MYLKIKRIGFWIENGWSHRSIMDDITPNLGNQYNDEILSYLEIGVSISTQRTMFTSLASGDRYGPVTAYTDGIWAWTNILMHYYYTGWLELPEEFIIHAKSAKRTFLELGLLVGVERNGLVPLITNPDSPIIKLK